MRPPHLNDFLSQADGDQYHVSSGTARNHDSYRAVFARTPLGEMTLDEITDGAIANFARSRVSDGLRPGYINQLLGYLRCRLAIAQRQGVIESVPTIRALRNQREDVDPFNEDELKRIFDAATGWKRSYIRLLVFTGLRPSEAIAVSVNDVMVGAVRVNKRLDRRGRIAPVKSRHGVRSVPLAPGLDMELAETASKLGRDVSQPIFPAVAYRSELWWPELLSKAGVPYRPIYQLRHTFATRALKLGASVVEVAGWLGHSSIRHVCDVYSQWATTKESPVFKQMKEGL